MPDTGTYPFAGTKRETSLFCCFGGSELPRHRRTLADRGQGVLAPACEIHGLTHEYALKMEPLLGIDHPLIRQLIAVMGSPCKIRP